MLEYVVIELWLKKAFDFEVKFHCLGVFNGMR